MHRKILIAHTCFNHRFNLNNYSSNLLDDFGYDISCGQILFDKQVKFIESSELVKTKAHFDLLIISDSLFKDNPESVKSYLESQIHSNDKLFLFWHQTHGPGFYHYLRETYPNQLVANRACHHEENEPFFYLKDIVESNSLDEFTTRLQNLRDCLPSDEDLKNNKLKERILTVIIPKLRSRKKPSEEELQILETRIPSIREISNDSEEILRILNVIYQ